MDFRALDPPRGRTVGLRAQPTDNLRIGLPGERTRPWVMPTSICLNPAQRTEQGATFCARIPCRRGNLTVRADGSDTQVEEVIGCGTVPFTKERLALGCQGVYACVVASRDYAGDGAPAARVGTRQHNRSCHGSLTRRRWDWSSGAPAESQSRDSMRERLLRVSRHAPVGA